MSLPPLYLGRPGRSHLLSASTLAWLPVSRQVPLVDVEAGDIEPGPAEFDDERQADIAQADDGDVGGSGGDFR
jgi:hypothetical protein